MLFLGRVENSCFGGASLFGADVFVMFSYGNEALSYTIFFCSAYAGKLSVVAGSLVCGDNVLYERYDITHERTISYRNDALHARYSSQTMVYTNEYWSAATICANDVLYQRLFCGNDVVCSLCERCSARSSSAATMLFVLYMDDVLYEPSILSINDLLHE